MADIGGNHAVRLLPELDLTQSYKASWWWLQKVNHMNSSRPCGQLTQNWSQNSSMGLDGHFFRGTWPLHDRHNWGFKGRSSTNKTGSSNLNNTLGWGLFIHTISLKRQFSNCSGTFDHVTLFSILYGVCPVVNKFLFLLTDVNCQILLAVLCPWMSCLGGRYQYVELILMIWSIFWRIKAIQLSVSSRV